ncbi:MAG: site-specific integrase [Acidobacteria bacterium]|nr:site-specific integrase [Acidobacteriota bacterium]
MRAFRRQDLYKYVELRAREVSPGTVNRDVACIKSMFSYAVELGKIEGHPLVKFPMLPVDEISRPLLTVEKFRHLVRSMDRVPISAMVALMGETAMRRGEALQLKWDRIDLRDKVIGLQHTKNGKVRHVPLSDYAIEWLEQLVRYVTCPYVFVNSRTGQRWKSPEKAFQRGREDAKLAWVGFHDLRRFRAAQWVRLGLDVETVRKLLGHHDIQTTQLYIKGLEPYLDEVRAIQATEQSG